MKTNLAGRVMSVRRFESEAKSGSHAGEMIARVTVTVDCSGVKKEYGDTSLTEDMISFMLSKGDNGYEECCALEGEEMIHIQGVVTESNGYINVNIKDFNVCPEGKEPVYIMPEYTHLGEPTVKKGKKMSVK